MSISRFKRYLYGHRIEKRATVEEKTVDLGWRSQSGLDRNMRRLADTSVPGVVFEGRIEGRVSRIKKIESRIREIANEKL